MINDQRFRPESIVKSFTAESEIWRFLTQVKKGCEIAENCKSRQPHTISSQNNAPLQTRQ